MTQQILILSNNTEHAKIVENAIGDQDFDYHSTLLSSGELHRLVAKNNPDIMVLVMKQSQTRILEAICQLMKRHPMPVVMFVEEGDEQAASAATRAGISAFVVDGLRTDRVKPILTAAVTRFEATQKLRQALVKSQIELNERKLVERAKGLLMTQRSCSENEAYTALRTLAMKQNKRIAEIAQGVINATSLMA